MSFFDLPPRTLTILAVVLGFLMIDDLTAAEQNSLGNFLILIGQVLETNASQLAVVEGNQSNTRLQTLEKKVQALEQRLRS